MSEVGTIPPAVRTPFGLPTGSVRGIISLLICAFFWVVIAWPKETQTHVVLAHFFLLGMVLMAFASNPLEREGEGIAFLPWFLRLLFVGGSIAAVAYGYYKSPVELGHKLTPNPDEINAWWIPFLSCTAGGFSTGLILRFL